MGDQNGESQKPIGLHEENQQCSQLYIFNHCALLHVVIFGSYLYMEILFIYVQFDHVF